MNIMNLTAKLILDDKEYQVKLQEAKKQAKDTSNSTISNNLKTVASWVGITASVTALISTMKNLVYNTTEYAGSVKDLAQVYETTYQNVQELNYMAQESGKNAEWVLRKAQSSGESYAEILGLTNEEYAEMVANAHEMGIILEDEVIDRADMLGDAISQLKYQFQAVLTGLLAGEEGADQNLRAFLQRVGDFVKQYAPAVINFAVQLLIEVAVAFITQFPQIATELVLALQNALLNVDWLGVLWTVIKGLAEGIVNMILNALLGWLSWFGIETPQVDFGVGDSPSLSNVGANDYEITESVTQELTIKVESDGVTANDKAVADSLEDLIDEKLGKMLGGI